MIESNIQPLKRKKNSKDLRNLYQPIKILKLYHSKDKKPKNPEKLDISNIKR